MELSSDDILDMTKKLLNYTKKEDMKIMRITNRPLYLNMINKDFGLFHERYPSLFNMIIDNPDNFDINKLLHMLKQKSKVEKKEQTYENASIEIGQQYFNEYVKPVLKQ